MVYYFESNGKTLYMGKDKHENDLLIKYGLENDVWFHADSLSSAHVYLRLDEYDDWLEIPEEILVDCAQLTKANSIAGNKKDNVDIIYTPWKNLKKSKSMAAGEVSFKNDKKVKKIHVQTKLNPILNRLKKTRHEIQGANHLIQVKLQKDPSIVNKIIEQQQLQLQSQ